MSPRKSEAARPLDLDNLTLTRGLHRSIEEGMCVMELASNLAHEPWSDHPACVSPAIGAFLRSWGDNLDDATRQRLKPFAARVIGTATGEADELTRGWLATDWLVRTFAPAWLDLAGLGGHAAALRALPELTTNELATTAQFTIDAAESAAWSAAWSAAESAAWYAAWSAEGSAAGSAAWYAAESAVRYASRSASRYAAGSASRSAAESAVRYAVRYASRYASRYAGWSAGESAVRYASRYAGWSAGESALSPTVTALQESAFDLLARMIAVGKQESPS